AAGIVVVDEAGHQVGGVAGEADEPTVGADGGLERRAVPAGAADAPADQGGRPRLQIADVDVAVAAHRHAGHQVVGKAHEGDVAAVGGDDRRVGEAVGADAGGGDADQGRRPQLPVAHEHVAGEVGVVGHQVGGIAGEHLEAAVGANRPGDLRPVVAGERAGR